MSDESNNVVYADFYTTLDIPVERVLDRAQAADLKTVIVVGVTQDGLDYYAASSGDAGAMSILLQRVNWHLVHAAE